MACLKFRFVGDSKIVNFLSRKFPTIQYSIVKLEGPGDDTATLYMHTCTPTCTHMC